MDREPPRRVQTLTANVSIEFAPHLIVTVGVRTFAFNTDAAAEVVLFDALTPVPGSPPHVLGLFSHRGELLPVVDFSRLAGGPATTSTRAVLMRAEQGVVALTVDHVLGVLPVTGTSTPKPLGSEGLSAHLLGPAEARGHPVVLVDPDGLFGILKLPR